VPETIVNSERLIPSVLARLANVAYANAFFAIAAKDCPVHQVQAVSAATLLST
jgi:hypothetical protein